MYRKSTTACANGDFGYWLYSAYAILSIKSRRRGQGGVGHDVRGGGGDGVGYGIRGEVGGNMGPQW